MNNHLIHKEIHRLLKFAGFLAIMYAITIHLSSCDKMTDNYQEFLEGGEIVYPGKADSLKVFPGKYRIGLSWLITSDPTITSAIVFWNNKKDSTLVPITRTSGIDTVNVILENLQELPYTFNVVTLDSKGNRSINTEIIGTVYGDIYRKRLLNRAINGFAYSETNMLTIKWVTADKGTLGEEILYTDLNGVSRTVICDVNSDQAQLEKYNPASGFSYTTVFTPDSMAIDTFKTAFEIVKPEIKKVEKEINRELFSLYELPGDYSVPNGASNTVDKIWKNPKTLSESGTYISKVSGHAMPQWFTIDLGAVYELSRIKLFQRGLGEGTNVTRLYAGGNLMEFEVWGSLNPDPNYNPDDHNGDFGNSWVLLQSCSVNRPSGNTVPAGATRGDNSAADIAAAVAGHAYILENAKEIRYIRIKAIKNWDSAGSPYVNIASIDLRAMQY
ncbi:MAG: hypothetical protein A2W90_09140 [Bacteroidetes bacterium GWF2_42_66]|nr:MAG: hypothetical protein A2W92_12115 [Bacteroidetes bacterium GWA2_42_15]OFY00572.1 MAG: hypothetical protein A2W89_20455 [Bacteroidetes bacterium GWE2_42_39]OFY42306.1 MAG: hypothetical protein A2W90_09140 [Bacteroidetes bacterium GWF2_42_66]HAZ02059.1 hypothetical protein [Marinilabiliales bacterium]HBL76459.1 hypothetical protein [Prolixibacteraceae bacterium]